MARAEVLRARRGRNAALVETMLLAAFADGQVSEIEMQTMLGRILERPEFHGMDHDEVQALVERSATSLSNARDLEQILVTLRERLPDHKNRMLAFGLAAAIAFADHRATPIELGLLKTFQRALGISEDEVAHIVEVVERGGSLAEALGEPLERLYAEVMVLILASNGRLSAEESDALVDSLRSDPVFHGMDGERAQAFVKDVVLQLARQGLPRRLSALAHGLTTHTQRLRAFKLALKIAQAGGTTGPERKMLDLLQVTFGIADDEVEALRRELNEHE